MSGRCPVVAIVGMGPKGFYCLERLVAQFAARPLEGGLEVAVFNRSPSFVASPIYDPDEPEYLLVNNSVGEIDLWSPGEPVPAAGRGPDFTSWYQEEYRPAKPLTGEEYLSRAVVGRYLRQGFDRLLAHLPPGLRLSLLVGEVTDIAPRAVGGYVVSYVAADHPPDELAADKILLATGHSQVDPDPDGAAYRDLAASCPNLSYIPFVYPVASLEGVPAGGRVAMKGIGLTFIDAVLALTEGRGGGFERSTDGTLAYRPSGREPSVFPFSRTGLPMAPKPADLTPQLRPLSFATPAAMAEAAGRSRDRKVDFERDVWPLFELEMQLHYHRVAMGTGAHRRALEEGAANADADALRRAVDGFLAAHPQVEPFDPRPVLDPVGDKQFATGAHFHAFVGDHMVREITAAGLGLARSGVKAAISIWNEVRAALSPVMAFGGLTPASHRRLMEVHYPVLKRVVFGPPIVSIEKLLALHRAGVVDFSVARHPAVVADPARARYVLRRGSEEVEVDTLVDARYPPVDIDRDATPLYRNLRRRGMVRSFANRSSDGTPPYHPGAIDMAPGTHCVVGAHGAADHNIAVIGIPTEGNLFGNLSVTRDGWAAHWAAEVLRQLRRPAQPFLEGSKGIDSEPRA